MVTVVRESQPLRFSTSKFVMNSNHSLYENHDSYVHSKFHDYDNIVTNPTPVDVELVSGPCALNCVHLVGYVWNEYSYITFYDGSVSNPAKLTINLGFYKGSTPHAPLSKKKVYPIPGAGIRFEESLWARVTKNNQIPVVSSVTVIYR